MCCRPQHDPYVSYSVSYDVNYLFFFKCCVACFRSASKLSESHERDKADGRGYSSSISFLPSEYTQAQNSKYIVNCYAASNKIRSNVQFCSMWTLLAYLDAIVQINVRMLIKNVAVQKCLITAFGKLKQEGDRLNL